jgi:hypothetical protein|tara:strand:- start:1398 stop:1577 length:180 start_codon:yes stop_codon:yes gene_type:complete
MAKNLKGISLKGLSKSQKSLMSKHKIHHTKAHLRKMAVEMRKGKTFKQSHNIAMRKTGK